MQALTCFIFHTAHDYFINRLYHKCWKYGLFHETYQFYLGHLAYNDSWCVFLHTLLILAVYMVFVLFHRLFPSLWQKKHGHSDRMMPWSIMIIATISTFFVCVCVRSLCSPCVLSIGWISTIVIGRSTLNVHRIVYRRQMRNNSLCHLFNFIWTFSLYACYEIEDDTNTDDSFYRCCFFFVSCENALGETSTFHSHAMSCDKIPKLLNRMYYISII